MVAIAGAALAAALTNQSAVHAANTTCNDPNKTPPTVAQIQAMRTSDLYTWWQLSRRAADAAATGRVLGNKVPPCVQALVDRQLDFERELKYR